VDVRTLDPKVFDQLIELGAIDAEQTPDGTIAAIMPDAIAPERLASSLGVKDLSISRAQSRDAGSVWILRPRSTQIGRLLLAAAGNVAAPGVVRLADRAAFGTGLHPTTALCLEMLDDILSSAPPGTVLDVGTGSGVLALAALILGVPRALAIDIDDRALEAAAENAHLNKLEGRMEFRRGGPEEVVGTWPLVLANVLAAPLIDMAPALVRRLGHHGQLVLSGISSSVEPDVTHAYSRLGLRRVGIKSRAGWVAILLQTSW
jgi:ribosomal protein L11 methyltransferase